MAFDYASLLEGGGGGGGGQTAQSRAEANVDYGYTDRSTNSSLPLVAAIIAGAAVLIALILKR